MAGQGSGRTIKTIFHVDLTDCHQGEDYWLVAGGKRYDLVAHSAESRAAARAEAPHLVDVADRNLTHRTEDAVEMPTDTVVRVHLKHTLKAFPDAKGTYGVGNAAIHIPPPADQPAGQEHHHHHPIDYLSTLKCLIFHHPDLINKDPKMTSIIYGYMNDNKEIASELEVVSQVMRQMGPPTETSGWARLVPAKLEVNKSGNKQYFKQPTQDIMTKAGPVMTKMMIVTKNDPQLLQKTQVPAKNAQGQPITYEGQKLQQATGTSVEQAAAPRPLAEVATVTGDDWNATLSNKGAVHGLTIDMKIVDAGKQQVKLTFKNTYLRYLGAYVRFYDADGKAMDVPDWKPDDEAIATTLIIDVLQNQYDDMRFLGYMQAVNNVMAVPIVSDPGELEVTITFPQDAVSASLYGSGIGTGADHWPKSPLVGGLLTGIVNLAVPAFMLAAAAAVQAYKPLYDIVDTLTKDKKFISGVVLAGVTYFGAMFGISAAHKKMDWHSFSTLAQLLFNQAATKLLVWVEAEMAADDAAEEIPFAGWVILALNIATGLAQLAETIVAITTSPWNIENKIATSITTTVTIHPDPRHKAWPQPPAGAKPSYTAKMIYKTAARPTVSQEHAVALDFTGKTLPAVFPDNTLGGQVKLEVDYFLDDWLAAKATTGWMDNDESHVAEVEMWLVQYPIPLSDKSVYKHTALLTYQGDAYKWQSGLPAPTGTIADTNTSSSGNAISVWAGLSLSQRYGMIGFAWKAAGMGITSCVGGHGGQLFAMMNIDIPGAPMDSVQFPACGFDGPTQLIYDPYPPKFLMKDGNWVIDPKTDRPEPDPNQVRLGEYYVDPRKADVSLEKDGGYHLRKVILDPSTPFPTGDDLLSWARFPSTRTPSRCIPPVMSSPSTPRPARSRSPPWRRPVPRTATCRSPAIMRARPCRRNGTACCSIRSRSPPPRTAR